MLMYDTQAAFYDTMMPALASDSTEIIAYAEVLAGAHKVLELGAGTGRISFPLAEALLHRNVAQKNGGVFMYCLDQSSAMIEMAQHKYAQLEREQPEGSTEEGAVFEFCAADACGDLSSITGWGQYDAVVAFCGVTSLIGQEKLNALFKNIYQALRPGGIALCDGLNPSMVKNYFSSINGSFIPSGPRTGLLTFAELEDDVYSTDFLWVQEGEVTKFSETSRLIEPETLDAAAAQAGLMVDAQVSDSVTSAVAAVNSPMMYLRYYRKPSLDFTGHED